MVMSTAITAVTMFATVLMFSLTSIWTSLLGDSGGLTVANHNDAASRALTEGKDSMLDGEPDTDRKPHVYL